MQSRSRSIDIARRREVAARHHIDPRTLARALEHGPDAIRAGMTRDRVRAALAELGIPLDPPRPLA